MEYKSKEHTVQAVKVERGNREELQAFVGDKAAVTMVTERSLNGVCEAILHLEGRAIKVPEGDYVLFYSNGDLAHAKAVLFEQYYHV
jgi:ribosomal protein L14